MKFDGYELKDYIVRALKDLKFTEFTPVQKEVFNEIKSGKNILAKSKTGSGKTHAFLIPIFNDLDPNSNDIFATIIAPTRELATQIYKMAQHIASFSDKTINIKLFVSGSDREREIEKLNKSQPHIVIGTPGKIKDLSITTNALKVYTSKYVVVDEVDMTFEEGFLDDVDNVLSVSNEAKLMFFSATIAISIEPFLKKYMTNVSKIDINNTNDTKIDHIWLPLKHKDRLDVLVGLLETINPYLCIIFVNKKETVNKLIKMYPTVDSKYIRILSEEYNNPNLSKVLRKKVKKVEKGVETIDFKDTEGLKKIYELIRYNELDDPRRGKAVSKETMGKFIDLVEKNGGEIVADYHVKYYKDIANGLWDRYFNDENEND